MWGRSRLAKDKDSYNIAPHIALHVDKRHSDGVFGKKKVADLMEIMEVTQGETF